MPLQGSLSTTV